MNTLLESFAQEQLLWMPERGVGFYPVSFPEPVYGADYWNRYRAQDRTPIADKLHSARVSLVSRHILLEPGERARCVDVGVGGARFVEESPEVWNFRGFDVNPIAVEHLRSIDRFADPYLDGCDVATFWDSLEHIEDPRHVLRQVRGLVFVSIPIFRDLEHVLSSKHFRKDEHYWYFTRSGMIRFMEEQGFSCLEVSTMEQAAGREDIESFCFER